MSAAFLLPGNDLDAGFYDGLARALRGRGIALAVATRAEIDVHRDWPALVASLRARAARVLAGGGTLAGHSLGALAALLVAAEAPPEVRRLVLLEPIVAPARPLATALARAYTCEVIRGDRHAFRNGGTLFRRVADLRRFPRAAIEHYRAVRAASDPAVAAALFRELPGLYPLPLGRVRVPVLCVRGARSGIFSRLAGAALVARLSSGREVVLPGAGHWIANESDEAAAAAIARFIDRTRELSRTALQ